MADIIPFKAVRPATDKVALVTTRPYDDYSVAELASWLDFNPFSFLHIVNLAYVNQEKIDPIDRKSTRLNSSHVRISYAVFCLKKKKNNPERPMYSNNKRQRCRAASLSSLARTVYLHNARRDNCCRLVALCLYTITCDTRQVYH